MKWLKKLNENFEKNICISLLFAMLLVLTIQIILRYVFKSANSWSEELARYFFLWFIFIGASYAALEWAHIKIDGAMYLYPNRLKKYVKYLGVIVWLVYNLVIVVVCTRFAQTVYKSGQVSLGLNIKLAYVYAAIPVGYALMSLRLIQRLIKGKID